MATARCRRLGFLFLLFGIIHLVDCYTVPLKSAALDCLDLTLDGGHSTIRIRRNSDFVEDVESKMQSRFECCGSWSID